MNSHQYVHTAHILICSTRVTGSSCNVYLVNEQKINEISRKFNKNNNRRRIEISNPKNCLHYFSCFHPHSIMFFSVDFVSFLFVV